MNETWLYSNAAKDIARIQRRYTNHWSAYKQIPEVAQLIETIEKVRVLCANTHLQKKKERNKKEKIAAKAASKRKIPLAMFGDPEAWPELKQGERYGFVTKEGREIKGIEVTLENQDGYFLNDTLKENGFNVENSDYYVWSGRTHTTFRFKAPCLHWIISNTKFVPKLKFSIRSYYVSTNAYCNKNEFFIAPIINV